MKNLKNIHRLESIRPKENCLVLDNMDFAFVQLLDVNIGGDGNCHNIPNVSGQTVWQYCPYDRTRCPFSGYRNLPAGCEFMWFNVLDIFRTSEIRAKSTYSQSQSCRKVRFGEQDYYVKRADLPMLVKLPHAAVSLLQCSILDGEYPRDQLFVYGRYDEGSGLELLALEKDI